MSAARKQLAGLLALLDKEMDGRLLQRVGMKRHTTFKVGGLAEAIAFPESRDALVKVLEAAVSSGAPWRMLGAGSNLLVLDGGVPELLVSAAEALDEIEIPAGESGLVEVEAVVESGAGVKLASAVKQCQVKGAGGLEWAAGIPGTVGGAVVMNAGSLGKSMADVIDWVDFWAPGRGVYRVSRKGLDYSYRRLMRPEGSVVLGCGLKLGETDPKSIREEIVAGLKWRRQTQPLSYPSAGSVFKNPEGDHAGRLIEAAGLKGRREGDAQISDVHANFIVNRGRAKSREITALIELSRSRVKKEFGVDLETEIEIVGEEL